MWIFDIHRFRRTQWLQEQSEVADAKFAPPLVVSPKALPFSCCKSENKVRKTDTAINQRAARVMKTNEEPADLSWPP